MTMTILLSVLGFMPPSQALPRASVVCRRVAARECVRMDFGDGFYVSHDAPPPFGPKDGPSALPGGVYEITLKSPLGIEFEEKDGGAGLKVISLVSGGNAEGSGKVAVGDELVGVTAVRVIGAKYAASALPPQSTWPLTHCSS